MHTLRACNHPYQFNYKNFIDEFNQAARGSFKVVKPKGWYLPSRVKKWTNQKREIVRDIKRISKTIHRRLHIDSAFLQQKNLPSDPKVALSVLKSKRNALNRRLRAWAKEDKESKIKSWKLDFRKYFTQNRNKWYRLMVTRVGLPDFGTSSSGDVLLADDIIRSETRNLWEGIFNSDPEVQNEELEDWVNRTMPNTGSSEILTQYVHIGEISALFRGSGRTAPGEDGITYPMMRASPHLKYFLLEFFNFCIQHSWFPDEWKTAIVTLIPKKANPSPLDYRPIALLSCICKTFSGLMCKRIQTFGEEKKLFCDAQVGFRYDCQTRDNILPLMECIYRAKKEKSPLSVLFIDFAKAYDQVPFELINSVCSRTLGPQSTKLIKQYLSGGRAKLRTSLGTVEPFPIRRGVRQGDL